MHFSQSYSAVHNSGATLQNCPFCKFQVEFMICALIVLENFPAVASI